MTNHCSGCSSRSIMGSNRVNRICRHLAIFFHQMARIEYLPAAFQLPTFQMSFWNSSRVGISGQVRSASCSDSFHALISLDLRLHFPSSPWILFHNFRISSVDGGLLTVQSVSVTNALGALVQYLLHCCTHLCLAFRSHNCLALICMIS